MIKAEQVPKETVEAAAVQLSNGRSTAQAIAAALNAWPGIHIKMFSVGGDLVLLPLTQENSDEPK